jgi:hypothetical protein
MRFMIIVKATPESEAELVPNPDPDDVLMAAMVAYHQTLAQAGVLLDGAGLQPTTRGWRVRHTPGQPVKVIDGPFAESKELIAGYTLIQVRSRAEALEWSRRFPNPVGESKPAEIEVRQLYEMDDFVPSPSVEKFRALELGQAGKS